MLTRTGADFDLQAYLARIGFAGAPAPDAGTLRRICLLHPLAIPFENLTPLMGEPVSLESADLQSKMVGSRRGGYCFEQNTLLARALEAVGFPVTGLAARVLWERPADVISGQTHMVLRVHADGGDYAVDAGFGGCTLTAPLRLAPGIEQDTPHEAFRFTEAERDLILSVRVGGEWKPAFQLGPEPRYPADHAMSNYWVSTHPESRFRNNLIVSRPFEGGRHVLFNFRLTEHRVGQESVVRELGSAAEVREAVEELFGIDIPDRDAFLKRVEELPR